MKLFKRRRREETGLDMTPMIDCIFQLILFLLLTSGAQIPAIGVNLPGAASAREEAPKSADVTIRPDGSIFVNGMPIAGLEEIGARLDAILQKSAGATVTIRADGSVPYRRVVEVMDASRQAGYENVALAVRRNAG